MASTNKRSTTGGGDGENVPQGGFVGGWWLFGGDVERPTSDGEMSRGYNGALQKGQAWDAGVVEGCCGSSGALGMGVKR